MEDKQQAEQLKQASEQIRAGLKGLSVVMNNIKNNMVNGAPKEHQEHLFNVLKDVELHSKTMGVNEALAKVQELAKKL